MKKIIGAFILILGLGFIACENESKTGDPSIIAMVNNDLFKVKQGTEGTEINAMKFETWRPKYNELKVANENVFYLKAETDTTLFSIRVPYTLFEKNDKRSFDLGDVVQATTVGTDKDVAYATYRVYDNKSTKVLIAIYKTHTNEKVVGKAGLFSYTPDDKQVPGTITASFNANMKKEKPEGFEKLSQKQKEHYESLTDVKSFQDGMIYRMPVSAGK